MDVTSIAVLLAEGFEEIEALTIVDVLRRADFDVVIAGVGGRGPIAGAHGVGVMADADLAQVRAADLGMVVLPGGMPGSANLAADAGVLETLRAVWEAGGYVAAICAAPIALHAAGLTAGRRITCYPSFETQIRDATYTGARVQRDGRLITGAGPGTALEFALELVEVLGRPDIAEQLRAGMLVA
jgi:4-methyl-5(b-hydroxyethyl)-thiazole monophosphate biosynthesis